MYESDAQRVAALEVDMSVLLRALNFPEHIRVVGVHVATERSGPIVMLTIQDEKFAPVHNGCVMPRIQAVLNQFGFVRWGA